VGLSASTASTDALGTWKWQAEYPGDALNEAVALPCGQTYHSVERAHPSLSTGASPGSTEIGNVVSVGGSVSGGYQVGGDITLRLFGPDDGGCGSVRETHRATIASDGSFATPFTPTEVGTWRVTADYPGDILNTPAWVGCGQVAFQATKATPFVVAAATPTSAEPGTRLQAMTLVGGGYGPTGRISFRLYGPDDPTCSGIPAQIEEAVVTGSSAATTTGFVVQTVGTWRWTATYLGDTRNNTTASSCDGAQVAVVAKPPKAPSNPGGTPWETNMYFNCVDDHHIGVPDGGRLVLRVAWAAMTKKQVEEFLRGTRTTARVDGVSVQHADAYWGKTASDGAGGWVTRWIYDTGHVVTSNSAPFTVDFEVVATKTVTDGVSTWNAGETVIPIGGPCLVTGVAP
jgi:hypothetical protein